MKWGFKELDVPCGSHRTGLLRLLLWSWRQWPCRHHRWSQAHWRAWLRLPHRSCLEHQSAYHKGKKSIFNNMRRSSFNCSSGGYFTRLLRKHKCLLVSNQRTEGFRSSQRDLLMKINALPKGTSASSWFWTRVAGLWDYCSTNWAIAPPYL